MQVLTVKYYHSGKLCSPNHPLALQLCKNVPDIFKILIICTHWPLRCFKYYVALHLYAIHVEIKGCMGKLAVFGKLKVLPHSRRKLLHPSGFHIQKCACLWIAAASQAFCIFTVLPLPCIILNANWRAKKMGKVWEWDYSHIKLHRN